jgi:hypothetical protein|tara:strand:- start:2902 stop:3021 length:120 start_codon:yes stop_codon:yes gene_type:complete
MQEIAILIIIAIVAGMFIKNKKPELYKKVKDNIKNWHKE